MHYNGLSASTRKKRDGLRRPGHVELQLGGGNGGHGSSFGPRALTFVRIASQLSRGRRGSHGAAAATRNRAVVLCGR
jgi:hypothetical protein